MYNANEFENISSLAEIRTFEPLTWEYNGNQTLGDRVKLKKRRLKLKWKPDKMILVQYSREVLSSLP